MDTTLHTLHSSAKGVLIKDGRILLIQYDEEGTGVHYNLPGGRQRKDENLHDTVKRKFREEAGAEVDVGPLLFVYEFIGNNHDFDDGPKHSVSIVFKCTLVPGSTPSMTGATKPDEELQTDVCWVPLDKFRQVLFWPSVPDKIIELWEQADPDRDRYLGDIL